jgi:probable HAF family extracellular repeat protein
VVSGVVLPLADAWGINDAGQVAGVTGSGIGPVQVWSDGDVTPVTPAGVVGRPNDISASGQVVGIFRPGNRPQPFTWQAGVWTALPGSPTSGEALDVNGSGQVLATWWVQRQDGSLVEQDGVWDHGRMHLAPPVLAPGSAEAINDRGEVMASLPGQRAAVWQVGGGVTELGDPGGDWSAPFAINDAGQVAGTVPRTDAHGRSVHHLVLWTDGVPRDLGSIGGAMVSSVRAMNDRGDIVGTHEGPDGSWRGFVWTGGRIVDLGDLGGDVTPVDVNEAGQVVGHANTGEYGTPHAFVWQDGVMTDLAAATGHDWSYARDIDEHGRIAGVAIGQESQAVLWHVHP